MSQKSNDFHTKRMRKLLREALIELIEERNFDTITVGEIAQRAMVSRAAFYRYYQDKYDLVEHIFEEAMHPVMNMIGHVCPGHPPEPWVKLFEHVAEHGRLYHAFLGRKEHSWFATKMQSSLVAAVDEHVRTSKKRPGTDRRRFANEFVSTLLAGLFVDAIVWWLEQGMPSSPRQIATDCALLGSSILKEANTWQ